MDALTGIGNRRAFDEQLARELKRAEREGTTVALGMFDLDHFKAYNDAYGHPAGDRPGRGGRGLAGGLRATDSLARYGGEEFALVALGCSAEEALALVDRLRASVPEDETCSAGVALWDGSETARSSARADAALDGRGGATDGPRSATARARTEPERTRPSGAAANCPTGRELFQHPLRAEQRAPVGAPVDEHVVARAQVHRQVALDGVPLVVLRDQLVELVEAAALREGVPALGEQRAIGAALLAQRAVRAGEALLVHRDRVVDVGDALHPARAHAGLQVGLDAAPAHAGPARDRLPDPGGLVQITLDEAFRGTAIHRNQSRHRRVPARHHEPVHHCWVS